MNRSNAPERNNRIPIAIAVAGIVIEIVAIVLLSSKAISTTVAVPLIGLGMFLALVPMFALARRARERR